MINDTSNIQLKETIERIDGAYAPATIRAYKSNFERFIEFCDEEKTCALPADHEYISKYIKKLSTGKLKSASIRIAVASISAIHRLNDHQDPTSLPNVKIELRRMHRILGRESKQAAGINSDLLEKMLDTTDNSLRGLRDRALLMTAYDSMCRRSELVSLMIEDTVIDTQNKTIKIKLRRSKTDQDGMGRWLYLSNKTQNALLAWINAANLIKGKLFRGIKKGLQITDELSSAQVNRIYKLIATKSRLEDTVVKNISGHSMRVGAAQDLLVSGASLTLIMQRGRWSKADTVMRYIEQVSYV
jgi:site-specific recombinase XerD